LAVGFGFCDLVSICVSPVGQVGQVLWAPACQSSRVFVCMYARTTVFVSHVMAWPLADGCGKYRKRFGSPAKRTGPLASSMICF
jgi:hypothetical protein